MGEYRVDRVCQLPNGETVRVIEKRGNIGPAHAHGTLTDPHFYSSFETADGIALHSTDQDCKLQHSQSKEIWILVSP